MLRGRNGDKREKFVLRNVIKTSHYFQEGYKKASSCHQIWVKKASDVVVRNMQRLHTQYKHLGQNILGSEEWKMESGYVN